MPQPANDDTLPQVAARIFRARADAVREARVPTGRRLLTLRHRQRALDGKVEILRAMIRRCKHDKQLLDTRIAALEACQRELRPKDDPVLLEKALHAPI